MSHYRHEHPVNGRPIAAAAALVLFSIVLAAVARWTDFGATRLAIAPPVETMELKFDDRADGSIAISQWPANREIALLEPGTNGFVRVVMRGLAFERSRQGIGKDEPFRLMRLTDGSAVVEDPATGKVVTLKAFGFANAATFEQLFEKGKNGHVQ
jgi:putative photosynthetic complex assembly protein